jgi:polyphosphate kinase 2 (PPK2 family)
MKIDSELFRVRKGDEMRLNKWRTKIEPYYKSKKHCAKLLADHVEKLSSRQSMLYVHKRYALLLIFQAMDAAGKDGAIKHVMSRVNPQGCQVFSLKQPSAEELERFPLAHDPMPAGTRAHRHLQPVLL